MAKRDDAYTWAGKAMLGRVRIPETARASVKDLTGDARMMALVEYALNVEKRRDPDDILPAKRAVRPAGNRVNTQQISAASVPAPAA